MKILCENMNSKIHPILDLLVLYTLLDLAFMSTIAFGATIQIVFPDESEKHPVQNLPCPKRRWFHNDTLKCYPSGKPGPCPDTMIFYRIEDTPYGDCDCARSKMELGSSTLTVYNLERDRCFKTYEQGYCSTGEWLVLRKDSSIACLPNPCEALQLENPSLNMEHQVVLHEYTCVRVALPSNSTGCPSPYEIAIDQYNGLPVCTSTASVANYDLSVRRKLACRPGTKRDRLGKCRPIHQVSFSP